MTAFQFDGTNYSSARAAGFAHAAWQHRKAQERRRAGRQSAHDAAASARAAEKRAAKLHEIANRPRGRTEVIDGRPVYRAVPAFRARPYTPPELRKQRSTPSDADGVCAALKAEAPQPPTLEERYVAAYRAGLDEIGDDLAERSAKTWRQRAALAERSAKTWRQRAARKVRMARIRRRGW